MSVVGTVEILKGQELTDNKHIEAAILGWCIELVHSNHAIMLESAIYRLIKVHFRSEPFYIDLVDLFHKTTYQTEMGQLVDLITALEDKVDLGKFSLERHKLIVIYKTTYYSFYLAVACAMLLSRIPESYTIQTDPPTTVRPYNTALSILIPQRILPDTG